MGWGLKLRSALQLRACEAETPTNPTAREMLLHFVQVKFGTVAPQI